MLLYKTDGYLLDRIQNVQFAAARLVTGTKQRDSMDLLKQLHWLPIRQRIVYKIALLVFKCLKGEGPSYLCELLIPYQPTRTLRSKDTCLLCFPDHKTEVGRRAFSYAAPEVWQSIPLHVRKSCSIDIFKRHLKTHLFSVAFSN